MSNYDHSDFFGHVVTDERFFAKLNAEQKTVLDNYYHEHHLKHPYDFYVERSSEKLWLPNKMLGKTCLHTCIALHSSIAPETPKDYALWTCRPEGDDMRVEEYEILNVLHHWPDDRPGPDRIIQARGLETGRKAAITLSMGQRATWHEELRIGHATYAPPLPIEAFELPYH